MKTDQFNQILENLNEIPSENCWKTIENQLNIMMPTNGNSINGSNLTTPKSNSLLTKIVAAPFKAAAITGGVIAVSTATIIFINTLLDNSDSKEISLQKPAQTTVLQIDTVNEKDNIEQISIDNVVKNEPKIITPKPEVQNNENKQIKTQIQPNPTIEQVAIQPQQVRLTPKVENIVNNQTKPNPVNIAPKNPDPVIDQQELTETKPIKISIPNIFTPNGDGYNDFFVIEGIEDCIDPKLYIKSSNGKLIYQSSNYQNDWNGENCSDGVYMYYFTYRLNNIEEKMLGRVIIKR